MLLFICYPKCSTCQKAQKFLDEHGVEYVSRHIVTDNPQVEELAAWQSLSGLEMKKFFNTSGMKYRELNLKDKLATMSREEQLEILASDGMLVKRPLLIGKDFVLPGFKEAQWRAALGL